MCMDTSQGKRLEQAKRINDSFARIPEKKQTKRDQMYTNKGLKYREEEKCSGKGVSCGWVTLLASRNDYNM